MIIGDMEIRLRADIARLQRDMDSARQVVGNATAGMERAATMNFNLLVFMPSAIDSTNGSGLVKPNAMSTDWISHSSARRQKSTWGSKLRRPLCSPIGLEDLRLSPTRDRLQ